MREGNVDVIKRRWTKEEIEYLQEGWGTLSIQFMSKQLNRSIDAIRDKASMLGIGGYLNSRDEITVNQLFILLGLSSGYTYTFRKYLNAGLPVVKKKVLVRSYNMIKIDKFWKWAEVNKKILNFAKLEKGILGKEPKWVDEKRSIDKLNPTKSTPYRRWTNEEDNLLLSKVKSNKYTYADLAKEFNRTERAIQKRLYRLKVPYRAVPRDNNIKWTDYEKERLLKMCKEGYDEFVISKTLNKSQAYVGSMISKVMVQEGKA